MIFYHTALNDAQMIIIQNYLAAKFNVSLAANDVYTRDNAGQGDYDYDVAGIGRVNASNIHSDAQGTGIVRISNPSNLGDGEFLMWGHNNVSLLSINTTDVPAGVEGRLDRTWRVSEVSTGGGGVNVGNVDIQFDLSSLLQPITASDLRLLIDHDGDGIFNEGGTISIASATELACGNYLFSAVPANSITNGDRFTIGSINLTQTPLPVTLTSFTGTVVDGDALLRWATATERDNDFFTVERSLNGKDFLAVGQVDGAGTSKEPLHYEFEDEFAPIGRLYYRLKQTDYDGQFTYSDIIALQNAPSGTHLIVLPNPVAAGETLRVRVASPERIDASTMQLTVTDLMGRTIATELTVDDQHDTQLRFPARLAHGVYVITLRSPQLPAPLYTRFQVVN
jgi:hypothetical protein